MFSLKYPMKIQAGILRTKRSGSVGISIESIRGNEKGYDTEMREEGVTDIIKFGIAFSGKKVKIRTE